MRFARTDGIMMWSPDHQAAVDRLREFLPHVRSYNGRRNYDLGPGDRSNVSALSPWLRHRLILEEDVLASVLEQHSYKEADRFIQEVFWRGYFKGWLQQRPSVWQTYQSSLTRLVGELDSDPSLLQRYEEAVGGKTGVSCFDAWTNELLQTGYLHNHARLWYASIWCFTLKLPWELGADFFFRHLLDGDPASNTCSWRWVRGLHTIGKCYLARASNIEDFTEGRFVPQEQLATVAPEVHAVLPERQALSFDTPKLEGRLGMLVTAEDCSPDSLGIHDVQASVVLTDFTERSSLPTASLVRKFHRSALSAAASRCDENVSVSECSDWAAVLKEFTEAHQLDTVATARLPVGPIQDRLRLASAKSGVRIVEVTRHYDTLVWPHATAGFFKLKKRIPKILAEMGHPQS